MGRMTPAVALMAIFVLAVRFQTDRENAICV
jgi:hypothetical protein